jgi:methylmalonyl-CoA mutase N-terminal domain/subunit
VDRFAPRLSFFFNSHSDFFEEIAKFRAARRMWANIMRHRFGAKKEASWKLRFHTQTAGCTLTAQQPMNNIVRVALQALSAVLGGTQSLHTNSMDETLALPTEEAVTVALRTQQIIAEETGVTNTIDPLAGSYFIEWMTDRMEEEAKRYIEKIDEFGGMIRAIEVGYPQKEIARASFHYQRLMEKGEKTMVGVNKYKMTEPMDIPILKIDRTVEQMQVSRLEELKSRRDQKRVDRCLKEIREAAESRENLMPLFIDAVKQYCTLGEICGVLREVFGEYKDPAFY